MQATHLHLTLRFLGDRAPGEVPEIVGSLEQIHASRFSMVLGETLGTFGRPPRVLWLSARADGLDTLAAQVHRALGAEPEADPVFHVTWARLRQPPPHRLRAVLAHPPGPLVVEVTEVRLMASHLDPQGARYETVARQPLLP